MMVAWVGDKDLACEQLATAVRYTRANPPELVTLFPAPDQVALPPNAIALRLISFARLRRVGQVRCYPIFDEEFTLRIRLVTLWVFG